jgi:hypothetical protein
MAEKISWRCSYTRAVYRLGIWGLLEVSLQPPTDRPRKTDSVKAACSQLPIGNVMSLHMRVQVVCLISCSLNLLKLLAKFNLFMMSHGIDLQDSFRSLNAKLSFMVEIDKHMVTSFSSLVLHLTTKGHVFGAIMFYIFLG